MTTEDRTAGPGTLEAAAALPQVLKIVGSVVAPTTLLTALLFYFGRLHVTGLFRYLGVNFTVLDLTAQDYLIRSADGLFGPLTILAVTALLALWAHRLLRGVLPATTRMVLLRVLAPTCAITGFVLIGVAMAAVFGDTALFTSYPEADGLSLSIGVLLLASAVRLVRVLLPERGATPSASAVVAEWGAIFILVSIGLFWAVGSYAIGVGTGRGRDIEASLSTSPDVVLYSAHSLSLQAPGIQELTCQNPDAAYKFRYQGLKLVLQSSGQYLFLPAGWTHTHGAALLIPRSDAIRLEFSAAGQPQKPGC